VPDPLLERHRDRSDVDPAEGVISHG
jgi:hypothetical protein